jgi:acylphosphatase
MFSEVHCIVSGKVQQVAYRDFVQHTANEYGVTGWVRNKDDGTVELVAQGIPDDLKECIERFNTGSVLAHVVGVAVDWRTPEKLYDDFVVIY